MTIANDAYTTGSPSSATVQVNDDDATTTPTVSNQIPDQTATVGASFSDVDNTP